MPTFMESVQALPPELYDKIYDLTFTPMSTIVHVDEVYQPPASLRVSRATRSKFAQCFYGTETTFYVNRNLAQQWLRSLFQADVEARCEIRVAKQRISCDGRSNFALSCQLISEFNYITNLDRCISDSLHACLKLEVDYGEPGRTLWMIRDDLETIHHDAEWFLNGDATTWMKSRFGSSAENSEAIQESMAE